MLSVLVTRAKIQTPHQSTFPGLILPSRLTGKERRGQDDVPHPTLAVDLRVEAARDVARHAAGQSVQNDGGGVNGAVVVRVEHSQERHDDDS